MKRSLDVLVAATALLLLWPVGILVAVLVLLDDGGPVLFRQVRVGRGGRPFRMLKFRTMVPDAAKQGPAITLAPHPPGTRGVRGGTVRRHRRCRALALHPVDRDQAKPAPPRAPRTAPRCPRGRRGSSRSVMA